MNYTIFYFKNKLRFKEIRGFYNTLIKSDKSYYTSGYKTVQSKIIDGKYCCLAFGDAAIALVEKNLIGIEERKLNGKTTLVLNRVLAYKNVKMAETPTVNLYRIDNWIPFINGQLEKGETTDFFALYKEEIEPQKKYTELNYTREWDDDSLGEVLQYLLVKQLKFAVESLTGKAFNGRVYLQPFIRSKPVKVKANHIAFEVYFTSNLNLIEHISIGKKIGYGYGSIDKQK